MFYRVCAVCENVEYWKVLILGGSFAWQRMGACAFQWETAKKNDNKIFGFLGVSRAAGDFFFRIEVKKIAGKVDFCKVL